MAVETVDAVIAYGKALLRHAVASSGVLGGASTGGAAPQPERQCLHQALLLACN